MDNDNEIGRGLNSRVRVNHNNTTTNTNVHDDDDIDSDRSCRALRREYWMLLTFGLLIISFVAVWWILAAITTHTSPTPPTPPSPPSPSSSSSPLVSSSRVERVPHDDDPLSTLSDDVNGTLVLYSYYEFENDNTARDNLAFFIEVALPPLMNSPNVHIIFIINSDHCSVMIPSATNIWIHRRHNFGMDLCAYRDTLESMNANHGNDSMTGRASHKYRYHCWLNASVRGPFLSLPVSQWYQWLHYFTSQITSRNKLIGTSITCLGRESPVYPYHDNTPEGLLPDDTGAPAFRSVHVQSMFLVFDHIALSIIGPILPCSSALNEIIFGKLTQQ
jgi:hypothetical protein